MYKHFFSLNIWIYVNILVNKVIQIYFKIFFQISSCILIINSSKITILIQEKYNSMF